MSNVNISPSEYPSLVRGMKVCVTRRFLQHYSITHGRVVLIDKNVWDVAFLSERVIAASANILLNYPVAGTYIVCCRDLFWIGMDLHQASELTSGTKVLYREVFGKKVFLAQATKAKNSFVTIQEVYQGQELAPGWVKNTVLRLDHEKLFYLGL